MDVYIFQADIYCADCGVKMCRELHAKADEEDSDDYPQGPYGNGGGEADTPQHCGGCGLFLENPLTPHGDTYVRERAAPYQYPADDGDVASWDEVATRADDDGKPVLADWFRYYFQWGN